MTSQRDDDQFTRLTGRQRSQPRRTVRETGADDTSSVAREVDQPPTRRRWWLYALVLFLLLIFFAPTIIGSTGLKDTVIRQALGDFSGKVDVQSMSLGWLSPVSLKGVTVTDGNGAPLAEIESITTSKPLYGFLSGSDYGEIKINAPVFHVELRNDGSNVEDALNEFATTDEESSAPMPAVTIDIRQGRALVHSVPTNERWDIEEIQLNALISRNQNPLEANVECRFAADGQSYGATSISAVVDAGAAELTGNSIQMQVRSQNLPLALGAPVVARLAGPVGFGGYLSGDLDLNYDGPTSSVQVAMHQLSIPDLQAVAPDYLGTDRFQATGIMANGILQIGPSMISGNGLTVESNLGNVTTNGTFDLNQLSGLVSDGQLLSSTMELDGRVDLARLAAVLPGTLALYDDLKIDSGEVVFSVSNGSTNGSAGDGRMVVNVEAANILATRGAQRISWPNALRISGTVYQSASGPVVEEAELSSDFLTVEGNGALQGGRFTATGDLSRLTERLRQFADLGDIQLAGNLGGEFGWSIENGQAAGSSLSSLENQPVEIGGNLTIEQPTLRWPGMPVWQPEQLAAVIQAKGTYQSSGAIRIQEGGTRLNIGNESFTGVLNHIVEDLWNQQAWSMNCRVTGDAGNWLAHVQNFVDVGEIRAGGNLDLTCVGNYTPEQIRLQNAQYVVDNLAFDGYTMSIRDPHVEGNTNLDYDFASGRTTFTGLTLSANSVSAASDRFSILYGDQMELEGGIAYQADVNRVADWWDLQSGADSIRWYGIAKGRAQFDPPGNTNGIPSGGIPAVVEAVVTDFIAASPAPVQVGGQVAQQPGIQQAGAARGLVEVWREAELTVNSRFVLGGDFNSIAFDLLQLDSNGLGLNARGSIADLAGPMVSNLEGTWNPEWQVLNGILDSYTMNMVKLAGSGPYSFAVQGPVFPANGTGGGYVPESLRATTTFNWQQGEFASLPVGGGEVQLNLGSGIADIGTSRIPFGEGMLNVVSRVDLRGASPVIHLTPGMVAESISLNQETCRTWLKYVTPLAADATAAQGKFTVQSNTAVIPVSDLRQIQADGIIRLENVTIGAGPTSEQLIGVAQQIRSLLKPDSAASDRDHSSWIQLDQQEVPYTIRDGRVYHEGVRFSHDDIRIQTRGSVGFNQELNLLAEIPILDEWVGDNRYLQGLKGQSISIPIGGTVMRPQLDRTALQQLASDVARQAAGSAVNNLIEKELGASPDGLREQLDNRINEEVGGLRDRLFEKLGGGNPAPADNSGVAPGTGAAPNTNGVNPADEIQNRLLNGLDNLINRGG